MERIIVYYFFAVSVAGVYEVAVGIRIGPPPTPIEKVRRKVNIGGEDIEGDYEMDTMKEISRKLRAFDDTPPTPKPFNETNCICSRIYDPVCASNDRSYFNICQFECAMANAQNDTVKVLHQGNCIPFR